MDRPVRLAVLLSLLVASPSLAQVVYVNAAAPPAGDGSSWSKAFVKLQDAVAKAQVDPSVDQIWVAAGVYRPADPNGDRFASFLWLPGVSFFGGFAGTETSLSQRDPLANVTVLSGDLNGNNQPGFIGHDEDSLHVVTVLAGSHATDVLDGFTITGGNGDWGGGVFDQFGNITIRQCRFQACLAAGGGGLYSEDAAVTLEDCTFDGCKGTAGSAYFIYCGTVSASRCHFTSNVGGANGAVWVTSGDLTLADCWFENNTGGSGGALGLHASACHEAPEGVSLAAVRCTFRDNAASNSGGAIILMGGEGEALAVIRDSLFIGNSAGNGGALRVLGSNNRTEATLENCLLIDNPNSHIDAVFDSCSIAVTRCTVATPGSNARALEVAFMGAKAVVTESILWGEGTTTIKTSQGGAVNATYSCIAGGYAGTGNIASDPQFVNYATGATGDFRLRDISPCIDTGNVGHRAGKDYFLNPRSLDGDLDGALRTDMGAHEFDAVHLEISGSATPGGTLTIGTTGVPGLQVAMMVGLGQGEVFLPSFGNLFVSLSSFWRLLPWGTTPSSVNVTVPGDIPPGLAIVFQEAALGSPGKTLSNAVPIVIE